MDNIFNFEALTHHVLFHIKYGTGAVIVAIHKDRAETDDHEHYHVIQKFNTGNQINPPDFDEVLVVEENEGFVRIVIKVKYRHPTAPSTAEPVEGVIERILPTNQVTLEIVRDS